MRPYLKKVKDKHPYCPVSRRAKEHKTPKSAGDRETGTRARMQAKDEIQKELYQN